MSDTPNTSRKQDRTPARKRHIPLSRKLLWGVGTVLLVMVSTFALLCCFAAIYVTTVILPMTPLDLDDFQTGINSVLYYTDKNGNQQELRTLHGDENRIWVPYAEIPKDLVNATVAIEDQRFWTHPGVDWKRTAGAVVYMFTGQDIQGGSTLTQQLIKNITTYNDTTVKRKVVEIARALAFNRNYSKETTMEWYLNYIYLGRGCDGVYTASYMYFGKPLDELTVAECASLISITNNPSLYDPYTNPENNLRRKNLVLREMHKQGYLTDEEYEQAKAQELVFTSKTIQGNPDVDPDIYSWYEEQVITDVTNDLSEALGIDTSLAYDMVLSGGLSIYTCVDPEIQRIVEGVYENKSNFPYPSANGHQLQSAITVIDNATGDVVALAGQVGQKTANRLRNNATVAARQPGSSFKPLSVYAPAMDLGLVSPITVVDDYPVTTLGGRPYPANSGGVRYAGLTTVHKALTSSTNTVAFRIVNDMVTPAQSFNFVEQQFKIDLVDGKEINGSFASDVDTGALALGGLSLGVNTRDMAEAFAAFPNQGVYTPSRTYTKVVNSKGKVLLDNNPDSTIAVKASTAYYMNTMLQSVVTSGTGKEARFSGMHVAGKTGSTSNDFDRWFIGFTPYYVGGVWFGFDNDREMSALSTNPSVEIWSKVMNILHQGLPSADFAEPAGMVTAAYCLDSGALPTSLCRSDERGSRVAYGKFFAGDVPTSACKLHTAVSICTESGRLAGSYCPASTVEPAVRLDLYRYFFVPSVAVSDEKYTVHLPGRLSDYILSMYYPAVSAEGASIEGGCHVHTASGTR